MTLTTENKPTDLMMYDFNIVLLDMDEMIGEMICKNADDSFTVFINARWSAEEQRKCFYHALKHVRNNDWEKFDVQQIEQEAHHGHS